MGEGPLNSTVEILFEVLESPQTGLVNRTIRNDDQVRIILFSFAAGHELAAHKAPLPALLQVLKGEAVVTLGSDRHEAAAGFLAHMPADLVHAIQANTPLLLMLTLLKTPSSTAIIG